MSDGLFKTILRFGVETVRDLNPITGGPAAPLEASALLDSYGPSLMPRSSLHQGMAAGLTLITAEAVGVAVDAVARRIAPERSPLAWRIAARGVLSAAGVAVSRIPEEDDEQTRVAALRSGGRILAVAAAGGIISETGRAVEDRIDRPAIDVLTGLGGLAYLATRVGQDLETRQALIQRWREDDKPASLGTSLGIGFAMATVGSSIGKGFRSSRRSLVAYMGPRAGQQTVGRMINLGLWAAGAVGVYAGVVRRLSKHNSKIEPGYSVPPESEHVSGGPRSLSPFSELGLQGRRFVTDVVSPSVIDETLGESGATHPVRVYVGVESEPIYATARSELALQDMERLGAFQKRYLLLVSPTGTGWVDHTMVEAAEILARGDISTVCIQYGKAPSFLEIQGVSAGRAQFRQLLWGVRQRLLTVAPEDRPKVMVFGESLGAWSSSDVVMHQGIAGFDHYGIENALWFGLPGLARWSRTGMREGRNALTPPGTVGAFDRFEQYEQLSEEERARLRAVVLDHDNDPIAQMSLRLMVKRPRWLQGERGRNVPESMQWQPLITFIQILADAMNAMVTIPGEYKSFGHDYRGDTQQFVQAVYDLPGVSDEQAAALHECLIRREIERGERIKAGAETIDLAGEVPVGSIQ